MIRLQKPYDDYEGDARITNDYQAHLAYSSAPGVDFAVPENSAVLAAASGVVTRCHWGIHGGRYLMLSHGNGVYTLYSHLLSVNRVIGEQVEAGNIIARSGNSGRSTGPHLHFAVKVHGKWVDPEPLLER